MVVHFPFFGGGGGVLPGFGGNTSRPGPDGFPGVLLGQLGGVVVLVAIIQMGLLRRSYCYL